MVHQLINEHEKVQTCLAVMVNDIRVDDMRLPNEMGYILIVLVGPYGPTVTEADAAIEEVTNAMMSQSYDHGSEWRIKNRETDTSMVERYGQYSVTVRFRVKDSY